MNKKQGQFITIEGQDGAGKTTNLQYLCNILELHDIDYIVTREPGGTPLGEAIREVLLSQNEINIVPMSELLLVFAARSQHLEEVINPALEQGVWVVCDRFTDASYAYQGGGHGLNSDIIKQIAKLVQQGREPDLTLLLDVDIATGESRVNTRNETKDRFEQQETQFKKKVRDCYLQLAHDNPERIKLVNAGLEINSVKKQVEQVILQFLKK